MGCHFWVFTCTAKVLVSCSNYCTFSHDSVYLTDSDQAFMPMAQVQFTTQKRNIGLDAGAKHDYSDKGFRGEDEKATEAHLFINIAGTETTLDMGSVDVTDDGKGIIK